MDLMRKIELKKVCGNCSFVDAERFEERVICVFDGHSINPEDEGCDHHFLMPGWKQLIEDPNLLTTAAGQEIAGLKRAGDDSRSQYT